MIIQIIDLMTNRVVQLEVSPDNTLEEVKDAAIKALKLPTDYSYSLIFGSKEYGRSHYDKTLAELGIRDNDTLQLIGRPVGG